MAFTENRQALFGAMPCRAGSHNLFSRFQTDIAALNGVARIIVNALFNFRTEIADQAPE